MPCLVLDANYLCHRAYHAHSDLYHSGLPTGVAYGFFRDIVKLTDLHAAQSLVFCFDYGRNKRLDRYADYKKKRVSDGQVGRSELVGQIDSLRTRYLPTLGYRNVFWQEGYEADDVIASVCGTLRGRCIIVSADTDLYQLLTDRVSMWDPRKGSMVTRESFMKEYRISPEQWPDVKALAGCPSDNVQGVRGVGIKTAIKFLAGTLDPQLKVFDSIVHSNDTWKRNLPLVQLPYSGTHRFVCRPDDVNKQSWNWVMQKLGMKLLVGALHTL